MKTDTATLARRFLALTGSDLPLATVEAALADLIADDRRAAVTPFASHLRTRRTENLAAPVFIRARRDLNVTREELVSPSSKRWLVAKRDQVIEWLREAGLTLLSIEALVNRSHSRVVAALRRQRARAAARDASVVVVLDGARMAAR